MERKRVEKRVKLRRREEEGGKMWNRLEESRGDRTLAEERGWKRGENWIERKYKENEE